MTKKWSKSDRKVTEKWSKSDQKVTKKLLEKTVKFNSHGTVENGPL